MISETKSILKGDNALAEYLLRREGDQDAVRLQSPTAMMTALLYSFLRNSEYRDPFWMIIRGEREPTSIHDHIHPGSCCSESCVLSEIQSSFRRLDKSLCGAELSGLVETLARMRDAYLAKGGGRISAPSLFFVVSYVRDQASL